jgi:hypothetical protein
LSHNDCITLTWGRKGPDGAAGKLRTDAMKPVFHGVRTHWIRGFMAFRAPGLTVPAGWGLGLGG